MTMAGGLKRIGIILSIPCFIGSAVFFWFSVHNKLPSNPYTPSSAFGPTAAPPNLQLSEDQQIYALILLGLGISALVGLWLLGWLIDWIVAGFKTG